MITKTYCQTMASYNSWMNTKLYAICNTIPEAALKDGKGTYFGSVFEALNYLLYREKYGWQGLLIKLLKIQI
jgi:uncharacterized damage-inducible protein DinB